VDAIVNYKISRFEDIYPYFVNYIEYIFYRTRTGINIMHLPSPLSFYIDYYLEMKYSLNTSDFKIFKSNIQQFLNDYEDQLIRERILNKIELSQIKDILVKFSDYLNSGESTTFIFCITKILKSLKKWSNGLINKNIKNIFHLK